MASLHSFVFPDANGGVTVIKFRKDQVLFAQDDPADSVFYIQEGQIKVIVLSEEGKELWWLFMRLEIFVAKDA